MQNEKYDKLQNHNWSYTWWKNFKTRRSIKWSKMVGDTVKYTDEELEEKFRILPITAPYKDDRIFNFDLVFKKILTVDNSKTFIDKHCLRGDKHFLYDAKSNNMIGLSPNFDLFHLSSF